MSHPKGGKEFMQVISNFSKRYFQSLTLSRGIAAEWVLNTHHIIIMSLCT